MISMKDIDTVTVLKSLADGTRLSIVRRLAENNCETTSSDVVATCAAFLELSQPTMSHHFAKLVQAGVLLERKVGTEKHYKLNKEVLDACGIDVNRI